MRRHVPRCHRPWQLRHISPNPLDPLLGDCQRRQVRVRKVAVVRSIFFGAHGTRFAAVRIEQNRGLLHLAAVFDLFDLPANFVVDRLLHELETVQVLDLATGAQRLPGLAHRHVGVAPKAALLHVAVADADPGHELVQLLGVGDGFGGRAHVGLAHDFEQRRAGTIQVDARLADEVLVQRLAGIFFKVRPYQAHGLRFVAHEKRHLAALHHRDLELADLVALGQVGIEVVLAREHAARRDGRAERQAELDGAFDCAPVHDRQRARQCQIDGAGLGIGLGAEGGRRAAEDFARGRQLRMRLEADDDFIATHQRTGRPALLHLFERVHHGLAHFKSPLGFACANRWLAGIDALR